MDIACPNCAATYRVPEALLAQGKPLRCAACGETWVPEVPPAPAGEEVARVAQPPAVETAVQPLPDESRAAAPIEPEPPPTPAVAPVRPGPPLTPPPLHPPVLQRRAAPAGARRQRVALRVAWGMSITMVLLALAGLFFYGDAIAAAWPPFARVTALIGG
jgi:predicted Zn finger-like uncharacterized protein